jgi:hypothetical protein
VWGFAEGVVTGAGGTGGRTANGVLAVGRTYEASIEVFDYISGSIGRPYDGIGANFRAISGNGVFSVVFTAGTTGLTFYGIDFFGKFRNVACRELPGNHASQATLPARPQLSARVNLLTKTEQLADAAWSKTAVGTGILPVVTDNYAPAPDGTQTAARLQLSVASGTTSADISYLTQFISNTSAVFGSMWLRSNTGSSKLLTLRVGPTLVQRTITTEWAEFTITGATGGRIDILLYGSIGGGGSADILVWHPGLYFAQSSRYQRVNTAADYDTAGFPLYYAFDNFDDAMVTTFPAALGNNCTVVRSVPGVGAAITTGQTIGTTYTNTLTHSGLLIFDRPLTAGETAAVTRWGNLRAGV